MTTATRVTAGQRLRQRREEVGLSQRELAAATGRVLSAAYISRIEAGTRTPSGNAALVLAEPLQTTATWLLYGETLCCPYCGR